MRRYTIELDATDIVKLIAACNVAIASERETLDYFSHDHRKIINTTRASIEKLEGLKRKLKNTVLREE